MAKKSKQTTPKAGKKILLKEIEDKLKETVKGYHKKVSKKTLGKKIHKAGKILANSLTKEQITVVHKEKSKAPKKDKKAAEQEIAS